MSVDVARSLIPIVVNKETLPDKSCKKKRTKNMQFITELTICVYRMKFETFTVNAWDDLESITNQLQFVITCKKRIILGIQQLDFSLNTKTGSLQQE